MFIQLILFFLDKIPEQLPAIASTGAAGISVLMVLLIGYYILRMPKDSPEWKAGLMRKYINVCLIIAIVCAATGTLNFTINYDIVVNSKEKIEKERTEKEQAKENAKEEKKERVKLEEDSKKKQEKINTLEEEKNSFQVKLNNLETEKISYKNKIDQLESKMKQKK